jgi:hypothetical protein
MSKKRRDWVEQEVDLSWMSLEQLGQAFHLLAMSRPPEKLPKPFRKLNPSEWMALEYLLVKLLHQKREQSVH